MLNGISDPHLKSVKHQVIASEHLQETFQTVTIYITHALDSEVSYSATTGKAWISAFKSNNNDHTNLSRNTRRGGGRGCGGHSTWRGGRGDNKGWGRGLAQMKATYYQPDEWDNLTLQQKQKVRDLHAKQDKKRNIGAAQMGGNKRQ